uniref:Uncharacterized protein n=1 Tax=Oryza sativa subsp. japonica TaxID=39947 RepID=Q9FVX9_ORYSJ|nr:hypothetical protein [Oryza sativa Japonica Group]
MIRMVLTLTEPLGQCLCILLQSSSRLQSGFVSHRLRHMERHGGLEHAELMVNAV